MFLNEQVKKSTGIKIWQDFTDGKIDKNPGIRSEVFDAWVRSKEWGVDPFLEKAPIVLSGSSLTEELKRKEELLSVATPVMEDIYSVIRGTSSGVWLANENAVVIKTIADSDVNDMCENDNLVVGADWSEKEVGSNAIGTALFLKHAVQLIYADHYRKKAHKGFCAATPIICPGGEIMGILNVTGFYDKAHSHTIGMVVAGASAIQREMRLRSAHEYIMETIKSLPSGIIIINQKGIITNINSKACEILKASEKDYLHLNICDTLPHLDCIHKALVSGKVTEESEYYLESNKKQIHITATCRPIMNKMGFIDGAVVILREIEAVFQITRKMAGYRAKFTFDDVVGQNPMLNETLKRAKEAAMTSANILILGESGTGKEVLAQSIHNASQRRHRPFVAINCGALPRELIGSELFGYEEGAFTGAKRGGCPGKFELANNGTLFLDEIGDMPIDLQLMLFRVLQERVVTRLGSQRILPIDVRLITATNKDLNQLVSEGLFRKELYYRLNVVCFQIPPLRQRKDDISILANHFVKKQCKKEGKNVISINSEALNELEKYDWPGNIRELENIIEQALIFSNGNVIEKKNLPNLNNIEKKNISTITHNREANEANNREDEKDAIKNILSICNGNISKASRMMGITRATLYKRIRKYNIQKNTNPYQV